jgi:hypothetical protein
VIDAYGEHVRDRRLARRGGRERDGGGAGRTRRHGEPVRLRIQADAGGRRRRARRRQDEPGQRPGGDDVELGGRLTDEQLEIGL